MLRGSPSGEGTDRPAGPGPCAGPPAGLMVREPRCKKSGDRERAEQNRSAAICLKHLRSQDVSDSVFQSLAITAVYWKGPELATSSLGSSPGHPLTCCVTLNETQPSCVCFSGWSADPIDRLFWFYPESLASQAIPESWANQDGWPDVPTAAHLPCRVMLASVSPIK